MTAARIGFLVGTWVLVACLVLVWVHGATARPRYHRATLICAHLAEDSAAHVRLVEFGEGRIVYRCLRNGY